MKLICVKTVYIRDDCRQPPVTDRIGFVKEYIYKGYLKDYQERKCLFTIDEEGNECLIANSYKGWREDEWLREHFILKEEN